MLIKQVVAIQLFPVRLDAVVVAVVVVATNYTVRFKIKCTHFDFLHRRTRARFGEVERECVCSSESEVQTVPVILKRTIGYNNINSNNKLTF